MLRTIRIWLLLFVIAGMPKLITIFGTTLVFMEEIENEEMTSPDRSIEEETVFDKPKTWKTPSYSYEPTPNSVLERLAQSGFIGKRNHIH